MCPGDERRRRSSEAVATRWRAGRPGAAVRRRVVCPTSASGTSSQVARATRARRGETDRDKVHEQASVCWCPGSAGWEAWNRVPFFDSWVAVVAWSRTSRGAPPLGVGCRGALLARQGCLDGRPKAASGGVRRVRHSSVTGAASVPLGSPGSTTSTGVPGRWWCEFKPHAPRETLEWSGAAARRRQGDPAPLGGARARPGHSREGRQRHEPSGKRSSSRETGAGSSADGPLAVRSVCPLGCARQSRR